ncbi:hypothetical protein AB0399_09955 [Streptomyces sp. NPDC088194]|uniref:DUF6907 domain-containing protein n=1 Tax=Streptomyces sp. NPDC088194 TaxID=3154931 RepID=UPI0034508E1C
MTTRTTPPEADTTPRDALGATTTRDHGRSDRTWTIATTTGHTISGYLPPWSHSDPTATNVPVEHLGVTLADINHFAPISGQHLTITTGDSPCTTVVFSGSMECNPYAEDPEPRVPVVSLQLVDDCWLHNLDPDQLVDVAAKLRAQADHLEHHVRPALIAAREDWTTHHTT